jgi:hypothetical protein
MALMAYSGGALAVFGKRGTEGKTDWENVKASPWVELESCVWSYHYLLKSRWVTTIMKAINDIIALKLKVIIRGP